MSNVETPTIPPTASQHTLAHWVSWLPIALEWIQLLMVGLLLDLLLFSGTEAAGLVRLGSIAALLVGVIKGQGWLLVLALQLSLALRESKQTEANLSLGALLYCATALTLIIYTSAGRAFRSWLAQQITELIVTTFEIPARIVEKQNITPVGTDPTAERIGWIKFIAIRFVAVVALTSIAMLLMQRLPITNVTRLEWLKSSIANNYMIWPGATMVVIAILLVVLFSEMSWRQMTKGQGRVYLRSTFLIGHLGELRMIAIRRFKAKRAQESVEAMQKRLTERVIDAPPKD